MKILSTEHCHPWYGKSCDPYGSRTTDWVTQIRQYKTNTDQAYFESITGSWGIWLSGDDRMTVWYRPKKLSLWTVEKIRSGFMKNDR